MIYYRCKSFKIEELVDPQTFAERGQDAWQLLRGDACFTLDRLRERYQRPIMVNNWHRVKADLAKYRDPAWREKNGVFIFRGFRPSWCTEGTKYSQHRLGGAFDCTISGMSADEVREDIRQNPEHPDFAYITCVENKVSWLHFDVRNIKEDQILWVDP